MSELDLEVAVTEQIDVELPMIVEDVLDLSTSETYEERLPMIEEYDLEVS